MASKRSRDAENETDVSVSSETHSNKHQKNINCQSEKRDRFIPTRSAMDMEMGNYLLSKENSGAEEENEGTDSGKRPGVHNPTEKTFSKSLESNILAGNTEGPNSGNGLETSRVLAFRNKAPTPSEGHQNSLKVLYTQGQGRGVASAKVVRHISSTPERMLDAPGLRDDYYLNLVSWGPANILAVALGPTVFLWNPTTGSINDLPAVEGDDYVSSVQFLPNGGSHIAIGTSSGQTQLWDATSLKQVRSMDGHSSRVSSLSWNQHIVSTGSRDTNIVNHDVRIRTHGVATLQGHSQEVCSLAWSPSGTMLASGGNDNLINLWEASISQDKFNSAPRFTLTDHQAAVKALAWCPFEHGLLATGAGTADRCIKFWNTANGALLNSIDTGTQVCALQWSRSEKEILSSHGYTDNSLCLWRYPSMAKIKELKGHTKRVLHMAQSPDGKVVVSAGADETLRFWDIFPPIPTKTVSCSGPTLTSRPRGIR